LSYIPFLILGRPEVWSEFVQQRRRERGRLKHFKVFSAFATSWKVFGRRSEKKEALALNGEDFLASNFKRSPEPSWVQGQAVL
jgi:hypothetical protein